MQFKAKVERFVKILVFTINMSSRDSGYVNPVVFGLFSSQFWEAVRTVFCGRSIKVLYFSSSILHPNTFSEGLKENKRALIFHLKCVGIGLVDPNVKPW